MTSCPEHVYTCLKTTMNNAYYSYNMVGNLANFRNMASAYLSGPGKYEDLPFLEICKNLEGNGTIGWNKLDNLRNIVKGASTGEMQLLEMIDEAEREIQESLSDPGCSFRRESGAQKLKVKGEDMVVNMERDVFRVTETHAAFLECCIDPKPKAVVWKKGETTKVRERIIIDNKKYFGATPSTPTLVIKTTEKGDEAYYQCTAKDIGIEVTGKAVLLKVDAAIERWGNIRGDHRSHSSSASGTRESDIDKNSKLSPRSQDKHIEPRSWSPEDMHQGEQNNKVSSSYQTNRRLFMEITDRCRYIRVQFTGKAGTGKTTLCRRICNEYVAMEERQPAEGAVFHPVSFLIDWKSKIWQKSDVKSFINVKTTRMGVLVTNMEASAKEASVQTGSLDQPIMESLAASNTAGIEAFKEANKVRRASLEAQSGVVFLSLWDMGEHTSFQASHNVFISSHGVYLLVFRLTDLLKDKMETDRLKKWIRLIGTFSSGELNTPRLKLHDPPLIFVGTFLDELKKKTSDFDILVWKMQSNIAKFPELTAHKFVRFCTADNSLGNDDTKLEVLRDFITDAAVHQDQWDRQIPARWLNLEMDLLKAREDGTMILNFGEVVEMNKESVAPVTGEEELKLALEFLHCTRSVVYFREFDHVITDPQWLAAFFSILITDDQFLQKSDLLLIRDLDLYTTKGELTDKLINSLLSLEKNQAFRPYKSILLALIEKFGLIVKILLTRTTIENSQFSETYTIPSKLMELQNVDEITSAVSNLAVSKTLCFVFKDVYVPDELFHRVFAEIMRRYKAVSLSANSFDGAAERDQATVASTACLYLGFGCFEVDDLSCVIVSMHAERSAMAVTVISPTESKLPEKSGSRVRIEIEQILVETLKMNNQRHFRYVHQLHCNFHLSPYDTPVQLYGVINSERGVRCKGSECEGQHTLSRTDTTFWNITEDSAARFQGNRHIAGATDIGQNTSDRRPSPRELGRLSRLINSSRLEMFFLELGLPDLEIEDTKRESYNLPGITLITKLFLKWTIAYPNKTINDIQQAMEADDMATDRIDDVLGMNEESAIKDMLPFEVWKSVPSEDEIWKIVDSIGKMYFNLCLELGLSPPAIEQCELSHGIDFKKKMIALFRCWIYRFQTEATICRLLSAMKVCQMDWRTTASIWSPS